MNVKQGAIVSMQYLLVDESGEEIDRSHPGQPLVYLHGMGQIVPGLEKELEGMKAGDKKARIKVNPEDAYGEFRDDLQLNVNRSQFPKEVDLEVGMRFWAQSPDGGRHPFTVVEVKGDDIAIDGNHPLAGETLYFDIEIEDIREATKEELEHGHAHGPGGHEEH